MLDNICCNVVILSWEVRTIAEKTINFKVDEELYKRIKIKVVEEDMTLKDYIIQLIKKDLEKKE